MCKFRTPEWRSTESRRGIRGQGNESGSNPGVLKIEPNDVVGLSKGIKDKDKSRRGSGRNRESFSSKRFWCRLMNCTNELFVLLRKLPRDT